MLYCHLQHHNNTINKQMQGDFFINICTSHFICKGSKTLFKVCVWEGARDWTELKYFDPHSYGHQRCVFLVLLMLNQRPWGSTLLGAGFLYCILSATSLVPKLHRGSRGPPRPGVAFPTTLVYNSVSNCLELQLDFCIDWVI